MVTTGTPRSLVDPDIRASLLKYYLEVLEDTANTLHIPSQLFGYSEGELGAAFHEANIDIEALWRRRNPSRTGLSIGKIAGMIAFRLSRFKIVHLVDQAVEMKCSFLLQDLTH